MKKISTPLLASIISATFLLSSSVTLASPHDKEFEHKHENERQHEENKHDKDKKHQHDENKQHQHDDDHHHHMDFDDNPRDGFYLGMSAISSKGDDFYLMDHDNEVDFDVDVNYRVQFLGLFVESPGLSSRRIHGLYATPAWGFNFFNNDTWSLDLFYETSTKSINGLEGIQNRKKAKRGGLRATGYFDNSQLQVIVTPYSPDNVDKDGLEASISYGHNWQFKNWNYYANVGVHYRSKDVYDYNSAVGYKPSAEGFTSSDGLSTSAEIGLEYPLSSDWVFGSFVAYRTLSDRVVATRQDDVEDGYKAGFLLTYVF